MLNGESVGVLVLSDDLSSKIAGLPERCLADEAISVCDAQTEYCLRPSHFLCGLCGPIRSWNKLGQFVVYRQKENKNYVQVSPLVETIHCATEGEYQGGNISDLNDPMIYLIRLNSGSVYGVPASVETELVDTVRLVFVDWYPIKAGTKVRYHVMQVGSETGEPERVYTSDWIQLPP